MIRTVGLWLGLFGLGLSCRSRSTDVADPTLAIRPAMQAERSVSNGDANNLVEYGFSACLAAGGIHGDAVDVAQSFYLEMAEEPWRYDEAKTCAGEYVRSRRNALGRNLLIPDCLAFMRGQALARILRASRDDAGATGCTGLPANVAGPDAATTPVLQ